MDALIVDCDTGNVQTIPMTDAEIAAQQQMQADALAAQQAAAATRQQEQQQQIAAANALIATAANPAQATALANFIRTVGVPI